LKRCFISFIVTAPLLFVVATERFESCLLKAFFTLVPKNESLAKDQFRGLLFASAEGPDPSDELLALLNCLSVLSLLFPLSSVSLSELLGL
jgi:hypothetical protein